MERFPALVATQNFFIKKYRPRKSQFFDFFKRFFMFYDFYRNFPPMSELLFSVQRTRCLKFCIRD